MVRGADFKSVGVYLCSGSILSQPRQAESLFLYSYTVEYLTVLFIWPVGPLTTILNEPIFVSFYQAA